MTDTPTEKKYSILLLDDPELTDTLELCLDNHSEFRLTPVKSALKAYKLFQSNLYDALIIEPYRSGDTLFPSQREDNGRIFLIHEAAQMDIPTIITSSQPAWELQDFYGLVEGNDYFRHLAKPSYSIWNELIPALNSALSIPDPSPLERMASPIYECR